MSSINNQFISILNDEETFTGIQGSFIALVEPDAIDQAMNGEALDVFERCDDRFYLECPTDLRRLADQLELYALAKEIEAHFEERRDQERRLSEKCSIEYEDPLRDTVIDIRNEIIVISYDGHGFYDLSDEAWAERSELHRGTCSDQGECGDFDPPLRRKIIESALKFDFNVEDINNCTMILFKNERRYT